MTIRRRITVVTAAAVAVTVVVVSIGAFLAARRQLLEPIDESLLRRAEAIARVPDGIRRPGADLGRRLGELIFSPRASDFDAVFYQIIFPDGSVLDVGEDELVLPSPPPTVEEGTSPMLRSVRVDDVHLRVVAFEEPGLGVVVQIARPLTEADQTLGRFAGVLAVGSLLGIALAVGLGTVISRSAVKPIEALRADVARITEAESLGVRIDRDTDDEVAELAGAFNELLAQLERSKEQQVRLVRDAGHELRTPLTALRMNLEILQRHDVSGEERTVMLDAAHAEVEELTQLVGEIVDLATDRYEQEPMSQVELAAVVTSVVDRMQRRSQRSIKVHADDSVVNGRRDALDRAVANVVANAMKWTADDGAVVIEVVEGTVTVVDDGPGIADADLPHVFERFYRSDAARTTPGSGLGLSIVQQIVADHGGTVFARHADTGSGACVGFTLPTI